MRWPLRVAGSINRALSWRSGCGITGGGETVLRSLGSGKWGPWECWGWGVPKGGAWLAQLPFPTVCSPAPVSHPLLTLRTTSLVVGDEAELLCEVQRGSPPILYSFHLSGDTPWNHVAPHGVATFFLFLVMSWQDAGNYSCEAGNSVSRETSEPETLVWMVGLVPQLGSEPQQAD